jgi:hypothetical protein
MDKDEFCRMWVKMNKTRVEKAKAEAKAMEEEMKKNDWLFNLYWKLKNIKEDTMLYFDALSEKEQERLNAYGFALVTKRYCYPLNDWYDAPKRVNDIRYELDCYFRKTA